MKGSLLSHRETRLQRELQRLGVRVGPNEGVLLVDASMVYGCSFADHTDFGFCVRNKDSMLPFGDTYDQLRNHRHRDPWSHDLSSRHGRRVCRLGSLSVADRELLSSMDTLMFRVDWAGDGPCPSPWLHYRIEVPLRMPSFSGDACCAAVSLRYVAEHMGSEGFNGSFTATVFEFGDDGHWFAHRYMTKPERGLANPVTDLSVGHTVMHGSDEWFRSDEGIALRGYRMDKCYTR